MCGGYLLLDNPQPAEEPKPVNKLTAKVSFDGTQFIIQNTDTFDWTGVKMVINMTAFGSGYKVRWGNVRRNQTIRVESAQFSDSDDKRFNPYEYKPRTLTVICTQGSEQFVFIRR